MQGHFGGQACLKAIQGMRPFPAEPKGIEQFVIDGFYDLTQSGEPSAPVFGPAHLALLMGWADHLSTILLGPLLMLLIACKALVGQIHTVRGCAHTGQTRRGKRTSCKEGVGQPMVIAARWRKAEAGDHARGGIAMSRWKPSYQLVECHLALPSQN